MPAHLILKEDTEDRERKKTTGKGKIIKDKMEKRKGTRRTGKIRIYSE
jgi:hypothetical protein